MLLDCNEQQLRFLVGPDDAVATQPLPTDSFFHAAGVYDGVNVSLYVNGQRVASKVASAMVASLMNAPLRLGGDSDGENNFDGVIDETRIYNRALSDSELLEIFRAGAARRCK